MKDLLFALSWQIYLPLIIGSELLLLLRISVFKNICLFLILALALGLGIVSILFFLTVTFLNYVVHFLLIFLEMLLSILLVAFLFSSLQSLRFSKLKIFSKSLLSKAKEINFSLIIFFSLLFIFLFEFILISFSNPSGGWDAFAKWNTKAKFLFRENALFWKNMFEPKLAWFLRRAYPLFLPTLIARGWFLIGREHPSVPITISLIFSLGTICLLYFSLKIFRKEKGTIWALLLLITSPAFVLQACSQYLEVPLAFYYLLVFIVLSFYYGKIGSYNLLLLAGFYAGAALWMKCEGVSIFCCFIVVNLFLSLISKRLKIGLREIFYFLMGALPFLLTFFYFRRIFCSTVPPYYSVNNIFRIWRYPLVLKYFVKVFLNFSYGIILILLAYSFIVGFDRKKVKKFYPLMILFFFMVSFYFVIYIVSPCTSFRKLDWLLRTSIERLFMQLFPLGLFSLFLVTKSPFNGKYKKTK